MKAFLFNQKMSFLLRSICFLFLVSSFLNTFVSATQHLCHPDQRDALLEFKNEFEIQEPDVNDRDVSNFYPKTRSWANKSDCCSWDGIMCDAKSGKVIGLDLSSSFLYGQLESNSSLFRLRHLRDLNLADNDFNNSQIPAEFHKLMELERLILSESSFSGQIPTKILQLTKLVSLDLSSYSPSLSIDKFFLHLLAQNLRNLRELDMRSVNTSSKIPHEFSNMRSLRLLNLANCNLFGEFPSSVFLIPNLQSITLNSNQNLRGNLPVFRENNSLVELSIYDTSFSGTIPDSISNLIHLTSLFLSSSKFFGKIPFSLGNLSHLSHLDLSSNNFVGEIPSSIGKLKQLAYFNVGFNELSGNLPGAIGTLKQLTHFDVGFNKLSGNLPAAIGTLKQLTHFDVGFNKLSGNLPAAIGTLKQLTHFDVGFNKLSGNLPAAILNLTQLSVLSLSSNQFTGSLPPINSQFSQLVLFSAYDNSFTGDILSSLLKIPSLTHISFDYNHKNDILGIENISLLPNLQWIYIQHNNNNKVDPVDLNVFSPLKLLHTLYLSGIPFSTSNITSNSDFLSHLDALELSDCNITKFPEFIRNQRNLTIIDLSNNKIKGQVPDWLWRMPELERVDLSRNSFSGFNESFKASPESQIFYLDLSSNAFQGPLFIPSRSLLYFVVSKNNFTGEIPRSICGLSSLHVLDLSDNNLHGLIPWCLETQMSSLSDLNLRNNSLSGSLPEIFINAKNLRTLDVSHNRIEGKFPPSLTGCSVLEVLNVGNNRIKDMFPFQLNSLQELQVLVLRSNKFHGILHNANGVWFGFPQLKIIDVSHNDFFGTFPSNYFLNWTVISSKRDTNMAPEYIRNPSIGYYTSLVLMSKGVSMEMERILTTYTAIDFSGNKLQGQIPNSIGLLKELRILNLSSNAFTGHIPSSMANLTNLESLDLSQNKISGEIPPELGTLSSLAVINISHNQLEGSIPQGTQFQRQKCSSYEGNPRIFAPSLKDVCGDTKAPKKPQLERNEEEEDESLSWIAAGIGFAPGVVFGLSMGYIVTSYKPEWLMTIFGRRKKHSTRTR